MGAILGFLALGVGLPPSTAFPGLRPQPVEGQVLLIGSGSGSDRDRAVGLAREGETDAALEILFRLQVEHPGDQGVRGDLAAVLAWAGRDAEAVAEGRHLPFATLDPLIAESVARAARNTGDAEFAIHLYSGVLDRTGERPQSEIGLALALLEANRLDEALARLPRLRALAGSPVDAHLAAGHILAAAGRWVEAAIAYRRAPGNERAWEDALVSELVALREVRADVLARERAESVRDRVPPDLLHDLMAGQVARLVEWAPAATEERGHEAAVAPSDRALEAGEASLKVVAAGDRRFPELRLRFDRLVALRKRERMLDVLAEATALEAEGVELPPYVLRVVADAALDMGDHDQAVRRYRQTLEGWPGQPEATLGLFWALVGQGDFHEADRVIAAFLGEQPERRSAAGLRESLPNPDRLPAVLARHLGWGLAGDLPRAQAGLADLHARAPMNVDIRQELASVLHWRGWHGQAQELYERSLALDPDHVPARIGLVSVALATDERPTARALADTLSLLAPESGTALRAIRQVRVDGAWEASARVGGGRSSGGEFGTRDRTLHTRLVSPPVVERVRAFVGTQRVDASYLEGQGSHDRVFAGLEVRSRPLRLRVEGNADRLDAGEPGASAELLVRRGDRWSVTLAGNTRSLDVPLRATLEGIRGWGARAGVGYRAHEGRRLGAEFARLEMTDGNVRNSLYLALEQQVVRRPFHRLALLAEGYGARSTREDALYFNPPEIGSVSGSLLWDWTLFRFRDRGYSQRATLTAGAVRQAEEATLGVASAHLEHRWEVVDRLELVYGINTGVPVYDGIRERRTWGHAGFTWRIP
jgi:biofilm PGA synthesis protein PgaA